MEEATIDEAPVVSLGTSITTAKVLFMMADYGHDPTETAVPYTIFKSAGYEIKFATEAGKAPQCDKKMLEGITQKILGAKKEVVAMYRKMVLSNEVQHPLAWSDASFSLDTFDVVVLPGGHDKDVRQIIDSARVHELMVDYFPKTRKPAGRKVVAAICHGVLVLANSKDVKGRSVVRECLTTTLPAKMEQAVYLATRPFLGDYYKTYGGGSEDTEKTVIRALGHPAQFKSSLNPGGFIVEDEKYNYISARYPGDAYLFAEEIIKLIESFSRIQ
ncbi:hypothetical protein DL766_008384 [Monosporascus sp. MC13-8B]|uniref:DJ-1/PfpI domain-containing protein n=1 Tax=Monosporascus cannonballus TaxID=155416 RepID=A0ABY0HCV4_9PEZI|nr:hypothetical protein DL762_004245 [Monosporascus cannonballus]RYP00633.1 hypothetical protein DL763_000687 [Monosporascus cannonballus]RYP19706.1 hypothetical protein DL766_008384 [Monosporascus sp. MC13-8B]